jgi:hypothetical protein
MPKRSSSKHPDRILSASEVFAWFQSAIGSGKKCPSRNDIYALTRDLQVILNRANNDELKRMGAKSTHAFKDLSLAAVIDEKRAAVYKAIIVLREALADLKEYTGPNEFVGRATLEELKNMLPLLRQHRRMKSSGRPPAAWQAVGAPIAEVIANALTKAGYVGRRGVTDPENPTNIVAANIINHAYGTTLAPSGFATGLRKRDRRKQK